MRGFQRSMVFVLLASGCTTSTTGTVDATSGTTQARLVLAVPGTTLVRPAAGALVRLTRSTVTTRSDAQGRFSLPTQAGHTTLIITHTEGATQLSARVEAGPGAAVPGSTTQLGDILLQANGAVRGVAHVDPTDAPTGTLVVVPGEPFASFTTDTGAYQLDQLGAGSLPFAAVRTGYHPRDFSGQVVAGTLTTLVDQTLDRRTGPERLGSLQGRVVLFGQTVHAGATLTANALDGQTVSATSGDSGDFRLDTVPGALVHVSVSKTGFSTLRIPYLIIPEGETLDVGELLLGAGEESPAPPPPGGSSSSLGASSGGSSGRSSSSNGASGTASSTASSGASSSGSIVSSSSSGGSSGSGNATSATSTATLSSSSGGVSSVSSSGGSSGTMTMSSSGAPPAHCSNLTPDGDETGTDCGGSCARCAAGIACRVDADCQSDVCDGVACSVPSCSDNRTNGNETAEDCGGDTCVACPPGSPCLLDRDCDETVCVGGTCETVFTVTVTLAGTGKGAVESLPGGLACGTACSTRVVAGRTLRLHGLTSPAHTFDGFSGACSGPADCDLAVDADKTVTATFSGPTSLEADWSYGEYTTYGRVDLAVGATGAVYRAADFSGGISTSFATLVSVGSDLGVVRRNADGTNPTVRQLGGAGDQVSRGLAALSNGNLVVVGASDTLSFEFGDPGQPVVCPGPGAAVLAGLTGTLGYLWSTCVGNNLTIQSVLVDGTDLLLVGSVTGTVTFGAFMHTAANSDFAVVRISGLDGSVVDARFWGGPGEDTLAAGARVADGSIYVAGACDGEVALDAVHSRAWGGVDHCLWHLDAGLNALWVGQWGTPQYDEPIRAVAVTPDGDAVVTGIYGGQEYFTQDPLVPLRSREIFLGRVSRQDGTFRWVRGFPNAAGSGERCDVLATLDDGVILAAGSGTGVDLGGGPLPTGPNGYEQAFVAAYTPDGTHLWSRSIGPSGNDRVTAMVQASSNRAVVAILGGNDGIVSDNAGPVANDPTCYLRP